MTKQGTAACALVVVAFVVSVNGHGLGHAMGVGMWTLPPAAMWHPHGVDDGGHYGGVHARRPVAFAATSLGYMATTSITSATL
jgi:hypothetical protein